MTARARLEEAIREDPDDAGRYLALGDLLQLEGDPRGELIAMQQAEHFEDAEARARWIGAHLARHPELLGGLAGHRDACTLAWRHGYLHGARIDALDDGVSTLSALLQSPSSVFLRELSIAVDQAQYRPVVGELAARGHPTLRTLALADFACGDTRSISRARVGRLGAMIAALPRLAELTVQGHAELGDLDASRLVRFALRSRAGVARTAIDAVLRHSWPALEELELWVDAREAIAVEPLADRARFPRLARLRLRYPSRGDELCERLAASGLLERLAELDLRGGDIGDRGASALAACRRPSLALAIDDNRLGDAGRGALAGHRATFGDQRPRDHPPTSHPERGRGAGWRYSDAMHAASDRQRANDAAGRIAAVEQAVAITVEYRLRDREPIAREELARALHNTGRLAESRVAYERALAVCERLGNEGRARHVRHMVARVMRELGEHEAAVALLERIRRDEEVRAETKAGHDPSVHAHVLVELAAYAMDRGEYARARTLYEEARDRIAGRSYERHVLHMLAIVDMRQGNIAAARAGYEHVLGLMQGPRDVDDRAAVLHNLAGVYWLEGDWSRAEDSFREAGRLSASVGDRRNQAYVACNLANLMIWRGNYAEAISMGEQALELFRDIGLASGIRSALGVASDAYLQAGDAAPARRLAEELRDAAEQAGDRHESALAHKILGDLALARGELDLGEELVGVSLRLRRELNERTGVASSLITLAGARLFRGDLAAAEEMLAESQALYDGDPLDHGWAAITLGLVELARGRAARAVELARLGLSRAETRDAVSTRRMTAWLAAFLAAAGEHGEARAALAEAARLFEPPVLDPVGVAQLAICRARVEGRPPPPADLASFDLALLGLVLSPARAAPPR